MKIIHTGIAIFGASAVFGTLLVSANCAHAAGFGSGDKGSASSQPGQDQNSSPQTAKEAATQHYPQTYSTEHLAMAAPLVEQDSHPGGPQGTKGPGVPDFWVRPGFKLTLVANDLGNARFMCFDDHGTLYLSRPDRGDILMLRPNGDQYEVTGTFVSGFSKPHGMCFANGWLWFTSDGKVNKAQITDGHQAAASVDTVLSGLPEGGHWWRSILVSGNYFFTSIGDASNISDMRDTDREKVWRYNLDGTGKTLWCSGIRNTEKLQYRPGTTDLFGCDQGSDWFGAKLGDKPGDQPITDFTPPDKFNHYVRGGFYGHPFIVDGRIPRYEYMDRPDIRQLAAETIPPAWRLGPHWAADGWTFLDNAAQMPKSDNRNAVIALHGSWNRSILAGYRYEMILFDPVLNIPIGSEMLVGTLSKSGQVLGRPVDVVQAPDGSLLLSDDYGNRIFRLTYVGN